MKREIMSEDLYTEPGIIKREYDKERIVDIYVNAESLRVYENPWVEGMSPNIPGPAGAQHPVSVVSENSGRRNPVRTYSVFLGAVCLLFLAGILALICLWAQLKKDNDEWRKERNQLLAETANLRKTSDQLTANYTKLSKEIDQFWRDRCGQKPKGCKSLDWSGYP